MDQKNKSPQGLNFLALGWCAALLVVFALLARSASLGKCATYDEPASLVAAWVQTHYSDYRAGPENPSLYRYYIAIATRAGDLPIDRQSPLWPAMLKDMDSAGPFYIDTLYRTPGVDADRLLNDARARMIWLGVALGALIAWWAWRWRGAVAAIVAMAFYCLDPNFLAHAPLLKNDVPVALLLTALSACIWLLGERVTVLRWVLASLLAGAAVTTKFSGVFAAPVLVVTMTARALMNQPWPCLRWNAQTRASRLALAAAIVGGAMLISYGVIWTSYGFRFELSNEPQNHFDPAALTRAVGAESSDSMNHPSIAWMNTERWIADHRILPEAWIVGFTFIHNWSLRAKAFLCGNLGDKGWWYYFPLAMLFKTPTATLVALLLAGMVWMRRRHRPAKTQSRDHWPIIAAWTTPLLYLIAAIFSNYDIGLRHIFPVYPILFIIIGIAAADAWESRPKLAVIVVPLLLAGLAAETIAAYPNYISFFNTPSGGARGGLRLLSNSNLDWGQDLPLLAEWQKQHPDRPVCLLYVGSVDPAYYKIPYYKTSDRSNFPTPQNAVAMHAVLAVSATVLQGTFLPSDKQQAISQLRTRQPVAVLGGSIYLYDWR